MKKLTALILAVILIVSGTLISCGSDASGDSNNNNSNTDKDNSTGNADDGKDADSGGNSSSAEESTEEIRIEPDLPNENFGGYTFTFLTHLYEGDDWVNSTPLELVSEQETGEPVNDAVYRRNAKIMEKYNVNFKMMAETDEGNAMKKAVAAGDNIYDAAIMFNNNVPGIVTADLLTNVEQLTYLDLSKPWWDPAVNDMSIDNKNYLLAGDLLILDNEATNALLFNKDLMADLGMELPYGLVRDGKWTMDKMNEYTKGASADLNGDGQMKPTDDRWGYVAFNDTLHAMLVGGGGALAVKNENDIPYMDFASQRNLGVIEKAMDIMFNKQDVLNIQADVTPSDTWTAAYRGAFEENRALFMWVRMRIVEFFRGMESNFGIIPMPKYDEAQENYYSVVNPYTGVLMGIPKSAENLDRISVILEALSAESRYTLQPAYYDIVLTRKYARDEESEEMLNIIFNSRVYDIGSVYSFGSVFTEFIALCNKSDKNVASFYEKKIGAMDKAIAKTVETFQGMS